MFYRCTFLVMRLLIAVLCSPLTVALTLPPRLQHLQREGLLSQPREDIYILGTVHIGSESAEEASMLIEAVRPSSVVVEVPPSRVEKIRLENAARREKGENFSLSTTKSTPSDVLFQLIPALAQRGWEVGGIGGSLFGTVIVGGSLLKRSFSLDEENETLPRRDEFAATIEAADKVNATIIASDYELDELIEEVSKNMSVQSWCSLAVSSIKEKIGICPPDPILRRKGESFLDWESRRRKIETSRASREHGEKTCTEFSKVLVENRDARFADSCIKSLESSSNGTTVCVIGLVHLDGVAERIKANPSIPI